VSDLSPMSVTRARRTWGAPLCVLACSVLALGLYAVGPAQLYPGDSFPDDSVVGLAAALALT